MKIAILKTVLLFFCCFGIYHLNAQEMQSGLLLVSNHKTKLIPLGKKVKIWAGEDNTIYQAKLIAVDKDFVYLSTGDRLPIEKINCIRRKRILWKDIGHATVTTGVETEKFIANTTFDLMFPEPKFDRITQALNDDDLEIHEGILVIIGGVVLAAAAAIAVGVVSSTAGVIVGIFEPRYYAGKWKMTAYNPAENVIFIGGN